MPHQEAEIMEVRLARVWEPKEVELVKLDRRGMLNWSARIQGKVCIDIELHSDFPEVSLYYQANEFVANLYLTSDGDIEADKGEAPKRDIERRELIDQFAPKWMPFFRRGCWLSGFPMEATAHEKTEWVQGFTQEEIEAWDLKF